MINDKEYVKKKSDNFDRLLENFGEASLEVRRNEVLRIEEQIKSIAGQDPDRLNYYILFRHKEELELLLDQRRTLLNWMFMEPPPGSSSDGCTEYSLVQLNKTTQSEDGRCL